MSQVRSGIQRHRLALPVVALAALLAAGTAAAQDGESNTDLVQRVLPNPNPRSRPTGRSCPTDGPGARRPASTSTRPTVTSGSMTGAGERAGRRVCRQPDRRSDPQVRPALGRAAGQLRQGALRAAARPARRRRRQRLGHRLAGQRRDRPPGHQVQPRGRSADAPRRRRRAGQRPGGSPPQRAVRRRHLGPTGTSSCPTATAGRTRIRRRGGRGASSSTTRTATSSSSGARSASGPASSARRTAWSSTPRAACSWRTAATTGSRSSIRKASCWTSTTSSAASAGSTSPRTTRSTRSIPSPPRATTTGGRPASASGPRVRIG